MKKKASSKKIKIALICAIIFSSLALSAGITYASYSAAARVNDSSGQAVKIGSNGKSCFSVIASSDGKSTKITFSRNS